MPVITQDFYPDHTYTAHDQTFGTDVDKMLFTAPGAGNRSDATKVEVGGSGSTQTLAFTPNDNNVGTITTLDTHGWAMNEADMDSNSDAKRRMPAGTWTAHFEAFATPAALAAVTITIYVYKVAASPSFTRTLLWSSEVNAGLLAATATSFVSNMGSKGEILFEPGETLMVAYSCTLTPQFGGLSVTLRVGDGDASIDPRDLRVFNTVALATRYLRSSSVAGSGAVAMTLKLTLKHAFTVAATGAVAMTKRLTLKKSFTVAGSGAVSVTKKSFKAFTVAGTSGVVMFVRISQDLLSRIVASGKKIFHIFDD